MSHTAKVNTIIILFISACLLIPSCGKSTDTKNEKPSTPTTVKIDDPKEKIKTVPTPTNKADKETTTIIDDAGKAVEKTTEAVGDAIETTGKVATDVVETVIEVADTTAKTVAGQKPIKIDLPKPLFIGTPTEMDIENLEPPLGSARPAFLAPAGTVNISLGKTVTSSDPEPFIGEAEFLTDGDKEGSDGSFVEFAPGLQNVVVDLESPHEIYAILIWRYHMQPYVFKDVIVQISDDPDFITNVTTIFNNDIDNSAGMGIGTDMHYIETSEGKLIDAKGAKGQYIRCYSNGNFANDINYYIEIEVHGKPAA